MAVSIPELSARSPEAPARLPQRSSMASIAPSGMVGPKKDLAVFGSQRQAALRGHKAERGLERCRIGRLST